MKAIKLVTFDATNTLLRFKIPPWEYYTLVGRKYGFAGTSDILKKQMENGFEKMNEKHPNFGKNDITWENWWTELVNLTYQGQLPNKANVNQIANKLINDFRTAKCWDVADGSRMLLNFLKQNGVIVGVISNFDPRLYQIIQNVSLHGYFDFILTSYYVGYSKPDKRIFEDAIRASKIAVKSSECLHVGDDFYKDYRGAKDAGWHALLVTTKLGSNSAPMSDHVFASIEDLYSALEQDQIKL